MIPQDRKRARTDARKLSDHLYRAEGTAMPKYLREASEDARTALETLAWAVNQYERDLAAGYDSTALALAGAPQNVPASDGFDVAEYVRELSDTFRAANSKDPLPRATSGCPWCRDKFHGDGEIIAHPPTCPKRSEVVHVDIVSAYPSKLAYEGGRTESSPFMEARERFWAEHGTACPWCKEVFYGEGDPIRKHAEHCEARVDEDETGAEENT